MYGLELRLSLKRLKGHLQPAQDVGLRLKEYPNRQVECSSCRYREDRDIIACINLLIKRTSDVGVWFTLELPSNVAVNLALTSPIGDEDKLGEPKRGSLAGVLENYNTQLGRTLN